MYLKRARCNDEDRLFGRTCRPVHASKFWIQAMHRYQTACRTHAYLNFIVKPSSKCKAEYACSTSQVYSLCANNVADHTPCDTIGCFNARYRQNKKLGRFKRSSNTLHYPVQGRHGSARACQYRSRASYLSAHSPRRSTAHNRRLFAPCQRWYPATRHPACSTDPKPRPS